MACFAASTVAELMALPVYYPFDLIKTRMQTNQVQGMYNNLFDAFVKTYTDSSNLVAKNKFSARIWLKNQSIRLRRFYTGVSIYGTTYVSFIALEFSLYETMLRKIETECKDKSLLAHLFEHVQSLRLV